MKKTLKNIIGAGMLSLALLGNSGCRAFFVNPMDSDKNKEIRKGYEFRLAFEPRAYEYDLKESKSVPVHPDDAGFLSGSTEVKSKERGIEDSAGISLGAAGLLDSNYLTLKAGLDLEMNFEKYGFCKEYTQQASDRRPAGIGSFVYDRVDPNFFSFTPFVAAKARLGDFEPYIEYGFPVKTITRDWGHYRYGGEQSVGKESDPVIGRKITIGLLYEGEALDEANGLGISVSQEDYKTKFGDIQAKSIMLNCQVTF